MIIASRSRRLVLATAVVIGLSACGSPGSESSSTSAPTATAVGTEGMPAEPPVITVTGGFANTPANAAGSVSSADQAVSAESSKMMVAAFYDYVYGGDAVDLTGPAASWSFEPGATPDPDQVMRIAEALGVTGDLRDVPADQGAGWAVGSADYTEPSLNVGADPTLGWWYNPGVDEALSESPACVAVDPIAAATEPGVTEVQPGEPASTPATEPVPGIAPDECEAPEPPANVPTAAEADARATELLVAFGLDPANYELDTYADEWSANVTAFLVLDGMRTPMNVGFGFGAEGELTWAGGFLASPVRGADYPRIGVDAAVERLNEQAVGWGAGTSNTARAIDTVSTITPPDLGTETIPAPETITVTLTDPQPSLEMLWASNDTVWLLPGYRFDGGEAGTFSVLAIDDRYLAVEEPVTAPDPACSSPATDVAVDDTGAALVGLCEAHAATAAEAAGFALRVTRIDGVDQAATMDFNPERYNVAVDQGVVTEVISVG